MLENNRVECSTDVMDVLFVIVWNLSETIRFEKCNGIASTTESTSHFINIKSPEALTEGQRTACDESADMIKQVANLHFLSSLRGNHYKLATHCFSSLFSLITCT